MAETPLPSSPQQEERTRAEAERIAEKENRNVQEVQAELLAAEAAGGTPEERAAARDVATGAKKAQADVEATPLGQMDKLEKEAENAPGEQAAAERAAAESPPEPEAHASHVENQARLAKQAAADQAAKSGSKPTTPPK